VISKALRWVVDRFGLGPIWDNVLDRQVPKDPWYHGDGMALMALLTVLVVTGVFLALGYCPAMDEAYLSVEHITHQQTLGWFVRGLHYWSGGLMVIMLFLHFCRQVLNGGYKAPREATWLVGVVLLFLVLATSLLGYILRWDERGLYGLRVALAAIRSVPYVGENLVALAQGGSEITSLTLTRMFALHVVAMPLLLLLLVAYHVYLVILHGTTTMGERKEPIETVEEQRELYEAQAEHPVKGEAFFPDLPVVHRRPYPGGGADSHRWAAGVDATSEPGHGILRERGVVVRLVQRARRAAAANHGADVPVAVSRGALPRPGSPAVPRPLPTPRLAQPASGHHGRRAPGPCHTRPELAALPIAVDRAAFRRGTRGAAGRGSGGGRGTGAAVVP
jgi:hypothetical protein